MQIALTRRLPRPVMDRLDQLGDLWTFPEDRDMSPQELMRYATDAEILVPMLSNEINSAVMDGRPNLKLIANYAVGFNNVDLEAARTRGITVTNTPGVLSEATADLTMALLLSAARRIPEGDRLVRRGEFKGVAPEFHLGWDLSGRILGIYGLGRIGVAVGRRAKAFGLKIIYHNRRPIPDLQDELGAEYVPFEHLLARSDFLAVTAPLTPETRHRFTLKEFEAMKPSAIIVNTGRGPIIKEADLAEALERNVIAAAGLDVYEFEPNIEPRLLNLENVVLCPHLGSATLEVRTRMGMLVADNIEAFGAGRVPPNRVI